MQVLINCIKEEKLDWWELFFENQKELKTEKKKHDHQTSFFRLDAKDLVNTTLMMKQTLLFPTDGSIVTTIQVYASGFQRILAFFFNDRFVHNR